MTFDSAIHHRTSIRLRGYDYAQAGMYFITVCTQDRITLFGKVINGDMALNEAGAIAARELLATAEMRPAITLDQFVIMPNHMHCILTVGARCTRPDEITGRVQRAPTVGDVVRGYKSAVTKRIRQMRNLPDMPVWQRNYYEHIIRNEAGYLEIAQYIQTNPLRWQDDVYHVPEA